MNPFPEGLNVTVYPNETFRLLETLHYLTSKGRLIEVPIGFKTDFATIPRIFKLWLPSIGKYMYAAAIHDYLLSIGTHWKEAADIFLEACAASGIGWRTRYTMYYAIRLFGLVRRKT